MSQSKIARSFFPQSNPIISFFPSIIKHPSITIHHHDQPSTTITMSSQGKNKGLEGTTLTILSSQNSKKHQSSSIFIGLNLPQPNQYNTIWRCPEMGVPLDHPNFCLGLSPKQTNHSGGAPMTKRKPPYTHPQLPEPKVTNHHQESPLNIH